MNKITCNIPKEYCPGNCEDCGYRDEHLHVVVEPEASDLILDEDDECYPF